MPLLANSELLALLDAADQRDRAVEILRKLNSHPLVAITATGESVVSGGLWNDISALLAEIGATR